MTVEKIHARATSYDLEIGAVDLAEMGDVVAMLSRGMRDNPTHIAVFGENAERRRRSLEQLFSRAAGLLDWHAHMLVARRADGTIVGVCGVGPPGKCLPGPAQQLRMMPALLKSGPRAAFRTASWLGAWARLDPKERHWYFGPLAVDAHLQGQGIGSRLMRVFCAQMDAAGDDAYLETDKPINVRFYERFGFEVIREQDVVGTSNWFMLRRAPTTDFQIFD